MLHEFITTYREEILARTRAKVAARPAPRATEEETRSGVPLFLRQLTEALRRSGVDSGAIEESAAEHGGTLLRAGLTVSQVVHGYGDICQAITELAHEKRARISVDEFHTLNRCLDDAIAAAVTEHARQRERSIADEETERLGVLAHELRNQLNAGMLAFEVLQGGHVGIGGSTGAVLGRSLKRMHDLVARSLAVVRLELPMRRRERVLVSTFVEEMEIDASIEATARGLAFEVTRGAPSVAIDVDREILAAAVANLLQNAFKFTRPGSRVSLRTNATAARVSMEVEDECGGLPPGKSEELFRPFEQRSAQRTGLGLGLYISRRGVEANDGVLQVRDLPGRGCVFTIDLPRSPP